MNHRKTTAILLSVVLATNVLGAQSGPSRLGLNETEARGFVMSVIGGAFYVGRAARPFLALAPGARAALVNELVGWTKTYLASPAFKQAWTAERDQAKPQQDPRGTVEDEMKAKNAEQQKNIDDVKKMLPMLPPADRAGVQEQIKQMEAMMKDPAQQNMIRQMIVAGRAEQDQQDQDDMKRWQDQYPADHNVLVARRLRNFLTLSATVNFEAKLVARDGKQKFVDPQYEQKPADWKMCYRAGREATEAARVAATAWLKELGK